ncbi:amidohydrolase [Kribbella sp. NPDC026596]|uniref:amidohydrolase n=1 Tax=Kribbella sp. NPDC026596 TaxID=3155122 RepID=UPI0033E479C2
MDATLLARLRTTYEDLHAHPELSGEERRTAGIAAEWLRELGFEVSEGVGRTGVVGVLSHGDGPTVLLRADMDALPVAEETGLAYASTVDGVMHACGHDMHVTCLLGAAVELAAARDEWHGTLVVVFQPAEETASGAQGMIDDGLYQKVPKPDIVLGQHVAPIPAGVLGLQPGPAFASNDSLRVTLFGRGGHGSRPEATVDPVVLAAATTLRLQTVVSREVAGGDTAVVTVGALNAGTKANIIPDHAELLLSVRTYSEQVRTRVLGAIERIVAGEAQTAGAPRPPTIERSEAAPALINDPAAAERTLEALASVVGTERVVTPGPVTGSEDVGVLAQAADAPIVFWLLGGADPADFAGAASMEQISAVVADLPSNHSPHYHPVPSPTIEVGVAALAAAARHWLG